MGQVLRRSSGRGQSWSPEAAPTSVSNAKKNVEHQRPPVVPIDSTESGDGGATGAPDSVDVSRVNTDNVLEYRDPQYDTMLSQMVGRIRSKPGGKLEMDEAFVVERYNRPLPKLRDTKPGSGQYEENSVPPGTLNVAQLRQIILLHEGKADVHDGPMDIDQIAKKFRVETLEIQRILQFLSLPPEDSSKEKDRL
ncbi:uncharacterized protein LOC122091521 [Macadamia integrifolia]|uniref:uncharacterized protein LOC122091521 n=1 Tax=Macadamia integrifolia TaxID=60698 RepID=UPI001C4E93D0|nr:uncharacterized protein LOC122091521 [Macadamia integrifolia]XP_042517453.1 uncharacterized protein LOC122091521 [Macadamia integrifolia]